MTRLKLYFHTGSANHGCEAIVRSTKKIIGQEMDLFSFAPEEDKKYNLQEVVNIHPDTHNSVKKNTIKYWLSALQIKLSGKTTLSTEFSHRNFFSRVNSGDIYISIGGDNYCYSSIHQLKDYNEILNKKGAKTVLWGCSLEEGLAEQILDDLNKYTLIVTRESLTYESLKNAGVTTDVQLCPDPAFQLDRQKVDYPEKFKGKDIVGLNLSPVILTFANGDLIMKNYENLISHLLNSTDYCVALIPHMLKQQTSDRKILELLYDKFKASDRIILLDDHNCLQMKDYIAQCRFFVGARTHSVIAAYSTQVPCLAISYSMKAKGIAKDIFGTYENYVCPVQNLKSENEITEAFLWLENNEREIRERYEQVMPQYRTDALKGKEFFSKVL